MIKNLILTLSFFAVFSAFGQANSKKIVKELEKVYSKIELESFAKENGSLDVLVYAYNNAVYTVSNVGNKEMGNLPSSAHSSHFTDFGVKILPYTQYFNNETPNELTAIKSLYQLKTEFEKQK